MSPSYLKVKVFKNGKWTTLVHKCRTRKGLVSILRRDFRLGCIEGWKILS